MDLIERLKEERDTKYSWGIYYWTQIQFAYNSNRIEGSKISENQTEILFDSRKIIFDKTKGEAVLEVDDIIESLNHFKAFDYILDNFNEKLSHFYIKELHRILKRNTKSEDSILSPVGEYKRVDNTIALVETSPWERTVDDMDQLLYGYNYISDKRMINLEEIVRFHVQYETIHPFADGNGRTGRLIMFKECFKNGILPFVIRDEVSTKYKKSLDDYRAGNKEKLLNIIKNEQEIYQKILDKLRFMGEVNKRISKENNNIQELNKEDDWELEL